MLNYYNIDYDDDDIDYLEDINNPPRIMYERADHFHNLLEEQFLERFRLTKNTMLHVLEQIEHRLEYPYDLNKCVSPINQLLVALRVCATGGHLLTLADFGGMHKSTVSRIFFRVSEALADLRQNYIKFPSTNDEILKAQNDFYDLYSFPKVIGAVDGTHIRIQSPSIFI